MMQTISILLSLLMLATEAWAVTLDAASVAEKTGTGTTLTKAHTVTSSGGNRLLLLFCSLRSTTITLTATYNGTAMSMARAADVGTGIENYVFYLANPATGTNNWVVTQSSALSMVCNGRSVTNANQASPFTDTDGVCASGTSSTLTLTTTANDYLFDIQSLNIEGASSVAGANQTVEPGLPIESAGTTLTHTSSRQLGSDGGVMSWSWTGASSNCLSAVSVAHSAFSSSSFGPLKRRMP